jgi:hypothetical protein
MKERRYEQMILRCIQKGLTSIKRVLQVMGFWQSNMEFGGNFWDLVVQSSFRSVDIDKP